MQPVSDLLYPDLDICFQRALCKLWRSSSLVTHFKGYWRLKGGTWLKPNPRIDQSFFIANCTIASTSNPCSHAIVGLRRRRVFQKYFCFEIFLHYQTCASNYRCNVMPFMRKSVPDSKGCCMQGIA